MGIRNATAADLTAIEALLAAAGLPREGVAGHCDDFVVFVEDATVIGTAGVEWHGDHALLRSVAVAPRARGRAVARRLCQALAGRARAAGLRSMWLLTTDAGDYFAGLGFEPCDRAAAPPEIRKSDEFSSLCPASAVLMRRALHEDEVRCASLSSS